MTVVDFRCEQSGSGHSGDLIRTERTRGASKADTKTVRELTKAGNMSGRRGRIATGFLLLVGLMALPEAALAYEFKIQNNLDVILMFDEVLNRQAVQIKSKPAVILAGQEGIVRLADGTSFKSIHLKIRYLAGQSGSPLSITFGNNKGDCFVNSNSDAITTTIDYDRSMNCGSSPTKIAVSGSVADILDGN